MSAYTTIREVVKNIAGKLAKYFVKERFQNIDLMPYIICPTFIIHGQKDTLIPYSHSQMLHQFCAGPCHLILPKEMDHNQFDPYEDLIYPFIDFLNNCQISTFPEARSQAYLECPPEILQTPQNVSEVPLKPTKWQKLVKYMLK